MNRDKLRKKIRQEAERRHEMKLDERETASVLAGLRLLQRQRFDSLPDPILEIVTDGSTLEALSNNEIDDLCQKINTEE